MANQIVLVPQHLLDFPPSVKDGISWDVEIEQRIYGCQLIQKAGLILKLEAVSIASAQTILHRFYFRKSLSKFDVRVVAAASLLLGCKLEEDIRRSKTLIDTINFITKHEDNDFLNIDEDNLDDYLMDHESEEFLSAKVELFRCERYILRELGFMVSQTLVHPHRYILQYIHALFKGNYVSTNKLSQIAWGYLNDSMRTTLCCQVQPAVIAVGSIFLAACDLGIPLSNDIEWVDLFEVSWDDVMKVCATILSLYKRAVPKYKRLIKPKNKHTTESQNKDISSPLKLQTEESIQHVVEQLTVVKSNEASSHKDHEPKEKEQHSKSKDLKDENDEKPKIQVESMETESHTSYHSKSYNKDYKYNVNSREHYKHNEDRHKYRSRSPKEDRYEGSRYSNKEYNRFDADKAYKPDSKNQYKSNRDKYSRHARGSHFYRH